MVCLLRRRHLGFRWKPTGKTSQPVGRTRGDRKGWDFTMDRDFCETDWLRIRGRRIMVMATTTPPMLKRKPSWSLLEVLDLMVWEI